MKFLDYEGLGHLIEELKIKFVQEQAGKQLTTNDFTNILKAKLDGIESGAEVNTVNTVNNKTGQVVITSDDIEFLSSVSGSTPTTVRAIIDDIIAKDDAQDSAISGINSTLSGKASTAYVDTALNGKVDKIENKGLSANDFTTALKNKLDAIEAGSQKNIIELVKRNGTNLEIINKAVNIEVPRNLSDLTNDKNFKTESEIRSLIQEVGRLKKEIVTELPVITEADENTMYLVPSVSGVGFAEYLLINGQFEKLGDTGAIDLTGYVKHTDISVVSNAEIDAFLNT